MTLQIIGSSSKGNGYIIQQGGNSLLIEAGVRFGEFCKALDFNIVSVRGALISHSHGDHAKYVPDLLRAGIKVFAPSNVKGAAPFNPHPFKVRAATMQHDVPCYGYCVDVPGFGEVGFVTDTCSVDTELYSNCKLLMIEANYCDSILDANIESGKIHPSLAKRIRHSHMSIKDTINAIKRYPSLEGVVLLHLSDNNSDASFKDRVERATGVPTEVAIEGLTLHYD